MALGEGIAAPDAPLRPTVTGEGLDETRVPVTEALHLPGYVYTSPEIFRLEKDKIFMKDWLCVGRVEEIEQPGDYMTLRIMGEPILLTRDENGRINAFANMCRHRGAEVATGQGNAKEFSCPYHGWTYDLCGKLTGAPYMQETARFDAANCRLVPICFDVWRGWIFVTFDADAEALDDFVFDMEKDFGFLRTEHSRLAYKTAIEIECNWKLVVENLNNIYHSEVLHKKSFGASINTDKVGVAIKSKGGNCSFYDAAPHNPSGEVMFGKMPWLEDKPDSFACNGFLAPNLQMFARVDEVHPVVQWPISPTRTRVILYQLFPNEAFAKPAFGSKSELYRDYMIAIVEEDRTMIESLQNAMSTTLFRPGPMSYLECGIHNLITYYLDRIFGPR